MAKPYIFTVTNHKGGTGKTTTGVTLATALSLLGLQVLLVDGDPQGHVTEFLEVKHKYRKNGLYKLLVEKCALRDVAIRMKPMGYPNLWVVSGGASTLAIDTLMMVNSAMYPIKTIFRDSFKPFLEGNENPVIIFDTSPSLSNILTAVLSSTKDVIIPSQAEFASEAGVADVVTTIGSLQKEGVDIKLFAIQPTMVNMRTVEHRDTIKDFGERFPDIVMPPVRRLIAFGEAPGRGVPIWQYNQEAANDYAPLVKKVYEYVKAA